jgi:hypothetical protein
MVLTDARFDQNWIADWHFNKTIILRHKNWACRNCRLWLGYTHLLELLLKLLHYWLLLLLLLTIWITIALRLVAIQVISRLDLLALILLLGVVVVLILIIVVPIKFSGSSDLTGSKTGRSHSLLEKLFAVKTYSNRILGLDRPFCRLINYKNVCFLDLSH